MMILLIYIYNKYLVSIESQFFSCLGNHREFHVYLGNFPLNLISGTRLS